MRETANFDTEVAYRSLHDVSFDWTSVVVFSSNRPNGTPRSKIKFLYQCVLHERSFVEWYHLVLRLPPRA